MAKTSKLQQKDLIGYHFKLFVAAAVLYASMALAAVPTDLSNFQSEHACDYNSTLIIRCDITFLYILRYAMRIRGFMCRKPLHAPHTH